MSLLQNLELFSKSKFHAEIQLAAHLELHPATITPRVISSSKAACYLCNLFIYLHGQYHVHKTHRRLYPGWRIPQIHALRNTQVQLTAQLATQIRALDATGSQKKRLQPPESPAPTISTFMSTVMSLVSRVQETPTSLNPSVTGRGKDVPSGNSPGGANVAAIRRASSQLRNHWHLGTSEEDLGEKHPPSKMSSAISIKVPAISRIPCRLHPIGQVS